MWPGRWQSSGACIAWGLDNNLTRKISLSDPLQIVELKGLVAGPVNIVLGLWIGGELPGVSPIIGATIVGFIGYGVSLALFVVALRHLSGVFLNSPCLGQPRPYSRSGSHRTNRIRTGTSTIGWGWAEAQANVPLGPDTSSHRSIRLRAPQTWFPSLRRFAL
jgi:hypothetical protein